MTIDRQYIDQLIDDGVPEGKILEYKQELPGNSNTDKLQFLATVSAFANTDGGDLIYGIVAARGADGKTTGGPEAAPGIAMFNRDQMQQRLEHMIEAGIRRRIHGIQFIEVPDFAEGSVLVIRIPRSWDRPHMVTFQGASKFYARSSTGNSQLDIEQIRDAFIQADAVPQRLRSFRDGRLALIMSRDTPVPLSDSPSLVLHIVPLVSLGGEPRLDVPELYESYADFIPIIPTVSGSFSRRVNIDGVVTYRAGDPQQAASYTQIFRTGQIEAVEQSMLEDRSPPGKSIPSTAVQWSLLTACSQYVRGLVERGVAAPYVVMVSLLDVRDYSMAIWRGFRELVGHRIDRSILRLPDVTIKDASANAADYLRPVFDALWNACGHTACPHYDEEGKYDPK